jgi:purine-nucleoside phosphorylase
MPSRVVTKVISAAAVALVVELTDLALEQTALSEPRFRVVRKILKAGVGAASAALLGKLLRAAEDTGTDVTGTDVTGTDVIGTDVTG